ncbi:MAG: hypothetical protein RMK29_05950 [Myxococcales bacterium]|nr:hypothetical protein [Myxococcota bacterium]MDW8281233.1 hypothetical protein [Myxococcales bacterium]
MRDRIFASGEALRRGLARSGQTVLLPALGGLFVVVLMRRAPQAVADTSTYLAHAMHRTPGYPLFLDVMQRVGGDRYLVAVQLTQLVVGVVCALHLTRTLRCLFSLPLWLAALTHLLLLVPQARYGHVAATESLSYSLFLLLLSLLTRSFFDRSQRSVLGVAATLFLLVLVRPQFVFLFPLSALYLGWLFVSRRALRRNLVAAAAFAVLLPGSVLAQAVYNLVFHGRFARIPFTGVQAITVALYLAEPGDEQLLPPGRGRQYFAHLLRQVQAHGWHRHARPPGRSYFDHFNQVYVHTYLDAVIPGYLRLLGKDALGPDDWVELDRLTLDIALRMFLHRLGPMALHVLKQMQETAGHLPLLMVCLVVLPLLLHQRTGMPGALALVAVGMMGLANYVLVALVEPLGARYTMYTEHVQIPFLVAFCVSLVRGGIPTAVGAMPVAGRILSCQPLGQPLKGQASSPA